MDQNTLRNYLQAGKIAAQVRREGILKLAKPGTSYLEVMDFCEKRILELKGEIAWAQIGINDVAAHQCPAEDDQTVTQEGDLVKIDIGVHLDGWIADNAMTIEVNSNKNPNNNYTDLIKASQNALKAALKIARPGTTLAELGEAQYSEAEKMGFTTVKNLCGHTLGQYKVHGGLSIPTFNNKSKVQLEEDWVIAIEPFVTDGDGLIKEKGTPTVFMIVKDLAVRTPSARKILDLVQPRKGLPFTLRDLTRKLGLGATKLGFKELERNGIIRSFPPLVEVSGGKVAQFEHSVLVKDKPLVYTRTVEDKW